MENKNKFKEFLVSTLGRVTITVAGMVIIYGILLAALASSSTAILLITWTVCAVLGWKALNKITPNIFLVGTLKFWFIYYIVKGVLALFIGALIAPFQLSKIICNKIAIGVEESLEKENDA